MILWNEMTIDDVVERLLGLFCSFSFFFRFYTRSPFSTFTVHDSVFVGNTTFRSILRCSVFYIINNSWTIEWISNVRTEVDLGISNRTRTFANYSGSCAALLNTLYNVQTWESIECPSIHLFRKLFKNNTLLIHGWLKLSDGHRNYIFNHMSKRKRKSASKSYHKTNFSNLKNASLAYEFWNNN